MPASLHSYGVLFAISDDCCAAFAAPPADWRVAGMTYNKYSNLCADMLRAALKEPAKAKAKARETIYYRSALWKDGQPAKQGAWVGTAFGWGDGSCGGGGVGREQLCGGLVTGNSGETQRGLYLRVMHHAPPPHFLACSDHGHHGGVLGHALMRRPGPEVSGRRPAAADGAPFRPRF